MKTQELLTQSEALIAPKLKALKLKELERHAQKLLKRKANAEYSDVIGKVIKAVPTLDGESHKKFETIKAIVGASFSDGENNNADTKNIIERLSVILMIIVAKKFEQIHRSQ